jgi:hypothetical protein
MSHALGLLVVVPYRNPSENITKTDFKRTNQSPTLAAASKGYPLIFTSEEHENQYPYASPFQDSPKSPIAREN